MPKINPDRNFNKTANPAGGILNGSPTASGRHGILSSGVNQEKNKNLGFGILLSRYKFILIFAVLVALAAGIFNWSRGERYSVSEALTVSRQGTQDSVDYKYDDYYAIKASDAFGDTVVGWFKTPEVANAINQKSGINSSGWSFSALSGEFGAAKISPNLVEVRFGASSAEQARNLADAIGQVVSAKAGELNSSSDQGISFLISAGQPVIVKNSLTLWWNILAGFLVGLVFGFFIVAAKDYLRS